MRKDKLEFSRNLRKNLTKAESILWSEVRKDQLGCRAHRQKVILPYIVDFWFPKADLIVEIDGKYHERQREYDEKRTKFILSRNKYKNTLFLRFTNEQIFSDIKKVIRELTSVISPRIRDYVPIRKRKSYERRERVLKKPSSPI